MATNETLAAILRMMAMLRDTNDGCGWAKAQTFHSIAEYTIEEAYELLDAVQSEKTNEVLAEVSDLLFHVFYYAQIANENGDFDFDTVLQYCHDKIERRNPHIFSQTPLPNSKVDCEGLWEKIKKQERQEKYHGQDSILDDVAKALPALMRSSKIQQRARQVGFDWQSLPPVFDKVREELNEVDIAVQAQSRSDIVDECGDLLFSVVNLCRHLKVNPELALRHACDKFETRFRFMEAQLQTESRDFESMDENELDEVWQKAKLAIIQDE